MVARFLPLPLFSVPSFPVNVFILFHDLSVHPSFIPLFLVLHAGAAAAPPAQVNAGDRGAFSMQMSDSRPERMCGGSGVARGEAQRSFGRRETQR